MTNTSRTEEQMKKGMPRAAKDRENPSLAETYFGQGNNQTSYSSNSNPSITTILGTWSGAGRSNPCASSHVSFSSIISSFSILKRLLLEPNVLLFLFLIEDFASRTSFAM